MCIRDSGNAPISTATIPPLEILEAAYPVRFTHWGLRTDSGGAGKHRGDLGAEYEIELLADDADLFFFGERGHSAPPGVCGGQAAARNEFYYQQGEEMHRPPLVSKLRGAHIKKGDRIKICSPGGGGYGSALDREIEKIEQDLHLGYISPQIAQESYGICFDDDGEVNHLATESKRTLLKTQVSKDETYE